MNTSPAAELINDAISSSLLLTTENNRVLFLLRYDYNCHRNTGQDLGATVMETSFEHALIFRFRFLESGVAKAREKMPC